MREQKSSPVWIIFVLLTIAILTTAWFYTGWRSSQRVLPRGVTIAGLPMHGMTREQALSALAVAYASPVTVYYQEQPIILVPEMVDLVLDVEVTAANLDKILLAQAGVRGFVNYVTDLVLQRQPPAQSVQPILTYSRERLDAFLARTAQQYDHLPIEPVPLPEAASFRLPEPGTTLDIDASRPLLVAALLSPAINEVHLVVEIEPTPPASVDILRQALDGLLADFTGVAGIFVKDLETGRELCYNCNVAFAGLSTLKIGIVLELYRQLNAAPDPNTSALIGAALVDSDNAAANLLLAQIGAGNPYTGALQVTDFLWGLSLSNTFLAAPYDLKEGIAPPGFTTPANSRTDITTQADPYLQTTPLDMGLLLESLYQCGEKGSGLLRLLHPHEITPEECRNLLAWLEQNQTRTLLAEGMPAELRMAHKQGWAGDTHADIVLVYSPGAHFVASVFLYQPEWLVWEESAPLFADIGRLVYRFFNVGG